MNTRILRQRPTFVNFFSRNYNSQYRIPTYEKSEDVEMMNCPFTYEGLVMANRLWRRGGIKQWNDNVMIFYTGMGLLYLGPTAYREAVNYFNLAIERESQANNPRSIVLESCREKIAAVDEYFKYLRYENDVSQVKSILKELSRCYEDILPKAHDFYFDNLDVDNKIQNGIYAADGSRYGHSLDAYYAGIGFLDICKNQSHLAFTDALALAQQENRSNEYIELIKSKINGINTMSHYIDIENKNLKLQENALAARNLVNRLRFSDDKFPTPPRFINGTYEVAPTSRTPH